MSPLTHVGVTPAELADLVEGEVWERWLRAEPALSGVASLEDLHALRGLATDGPLGALVRLAARDGGDDELAGIAVVHQLEGGVHGLIVRLGDLSDEIEAVVIGALWEIICTFPWRRRTRAYAANLMLDTKRAVMAHLQPGRTRRGPAPVVFVGHPDLDLVGHQGNLEFEGQGDADPLDLVGLLAWAQSARVVTGDDVALLVELVRAEYRLAAHEGPGVQRGACSRAAVQAVAERRGVCERTIRRQRDRVVAALREEGSRYLTDVA